MTQRPEMERIVDLTRLGKAGAALDIVANESECAALTKRFGFLGLSGFSARVTVDPRGGGQVESAAEMRSRPQHSGQASRCEACSRQPASEG